MWILLAAGMFFCQPGCVTQTTSTAPKGTPLRPGDLPQEQSAAPDTRSTAANEFSKDDSCSKRMDAILEAMIFYYHDHQELPPNLDALRTYNPKLELTCIENDQPYVYVRAGMRKSGEGVVMHDLSRHVEGTSRIVVYDPRPHPGGFRWVIKVVDAKPGDGLQAFVDRMNEPIFLAYH